MTALELEAYLIEQLSFIYDEDEAVAITGGLIDFYELKMVSEINANKEVESDMLLLFESALARLKQYEPLQYIIGEAWFYDSFFSVNKHVLIPRPETEELVHLILTDIRHSSFGEVKLAITSKASRHHSTLRILDMGTGSGCIPIVLKKNIPDAEVYGLDISLDALEVAKQNAVRNTVDVHFFQADMLRDGLQTPVSNFDIIVSNPPYITEEEKEAMHANVLAHEPNLALFVTDRNPLQFYEVIASFAAKNLNRGGKLYVEINAGYAQEVKACFEGYGFTDVIITPDMQGKDRMVSGRLV